MPSMRWLPTEQKYSNAVPVKNPIVKTARTGEVDFHPFSQIHANLRDGERVIYPRHVKSFKRAFYRSLFFPHHSAAAVFIVLHDYRVLPLCQEMICGISGRRLINPMVDYQVTVHKHPHSVIGGGGKLVSPCGVAFGPRKTRREMINRNRGIGRTAAPIEVNRAFRLIISRRVLRG